LTLSTSAWTMSPPHRPILGGKDLVRYALLFEDRLQLIELPKCLSR